MPYEPRLEPALLVHLAQQQVGRGVLRVLRDHRAHQLLALLHPVGVLQVGAAQCHPAALLLLARNREGADQ